MIIHLNAYNHNYFSAAPDLSEILTLSILPICGTIDCRYYKIQYGERQSLVDPSARGKLRFVSLW